MKNLPIYLFFPVLVFTAAAQAPSNAAVSTTQVSATQAPTTTQVSATQAPTTTQAPAPAATQAPSVTTNVDEVSLDLVVHDKKHKLITDLKREDFAVTDNGTPVTLNDFHLVRGENARGHMVTLVFDRFAAQMAKSAGIAAQKVLKALPTEGYSIAVLDVAGRLRLLQGFTQDRKLVEAAMTLATASNVTSLESTLSQDVSISTDKAEPERAKAVAQAEKDLIAMARTGADASGRHVDVAERAKAQILLAALEDGPRIAMEQHASRSLAGLLALVKAEQRSAERKAIIYFTQNRQMDSAAKEMVKSITAAATKAGVTLYTVDLDATNSSGQYQRDNARATAKAPFIPGSDVIANTPNGPVSVPRMQQEGGGPIAGTPGLQGPNWTSQQDIAVMTDFMRSQTEHNPLGDVKSPMADLAENTGGVYIDADSSLKKPLEQMVEDLTTYYEASYVPPIKEYDGSFRTIGVKALRKDLRVQSKSGYYAVAPGAEGGTRPFEVPLLKILGSTELPGDFKFRAAVLKFGDMADGNTNTLAVDVPISALDTKEDAHTNLYAAHASIVAQIKDKNGVVVEHFGDDFTKRGALETLDRDHTTAILMQRHFVAVPGVYTAEVVVQDRNNDKAAAQRFSFEVKSAPGSISLSDMVLVRKMDALHEDDDDPAEPLRYENNRVTANISEELSANAKGVSLFFILHPDAASKEPPTLEMEVIHNGNPGRRSALPMKVNAGMGSMAYLASFGSNGLAAGDYEVKAYLNQGGKMTAQSLNFSVESDGTSPAPELAKNGTGKTSEAATIAAAASTADLKLPGQLAITVSTSAIAPMPKEEARMLADDAQKRAVDYTDSLPNFMCIEVTNRSVDSNGSGRWKLQDSIVEMLRFRDKQETRTTLEVNGKSSSADHAGMKGALSEGEFGGFLRLVFSEKSKADFEWKETDELNGGTVQVYKYRVEKANSMFGIVGTNGRELIAGFHGQVFIDSATRSVRRITLEADDLPEAFSTHSSRMSVDYDYIAINGHDYLLPVSAQMRLAIGRRQVVLNTIEFRNYRRFGSNMRILGFKAVDEQVKP
jgi:VWFA-related protein